MKFSIITPEHSINNIEFLDELYQSLKAQTYKEWEWIILTNGKCYPENLPSMFFQDERIQIYRSKNDSEYRFVGALKQEAFFLGSGDILVEVDHDDILAETCLEELFHAYQDPEIGFVYSDNIVYHMTDEFKPYLAEHGWTYKDYNWNNKNYIGMDSFKPTSQSLSFIWYAPDHVRSWRKEVYYAIGGHNPNLDICDDHELMIRTYLNTKMFHINKPLYIYRVTGNNTWIERNDKIQITTVELFKQYAQKLAERDAELKNLHKVDIGGGINPLPGYLTVDLYDADIIADLNEGIPLPENSVGVLNASHVIEHLKDPLKTMSEIHRVLAHGGWAFIEVPSTDGRGAFQDPTHVSFWNENSFSYYTHGYRAAYIRNTNVKFQIYRLETIFPNEEMKRQNIPVVYAWLIAIKDGERFPGELHI
jgi:predicted SAM-dependent methyltransferase